MSQIYLLIYSIAGQLVLFKAICDAFTFTMVANKAV